MRSLKSGLISNESRCGGLRRMAMSMRFSSSHSCNELETPSRMCSVVCGQAFWNRSAKAGMSRRPAAGGAPTVMRLPVGVRRSRISSPVWCTSCVIASARSNSSEPAALSRTPRPWRANSATPNSCSSFLIWRLKAGCARRSSSAARLTLPARATCMKLRSSLMSMPVSERPMPQRHSLRHSGRDAKAFGRRAIARSGRRGFRI